MLVCNRRCDAALPVKSESMLGCARAVACSPDVDSNDALSTHKGCLHLHSTGCIHHRSRCNALTLSTVLQNTEPSAPTATERHHKRSRNF